MVAMYRIWLHGLYGLHKLCFSALPSLQTLFWMCILVCKCDAVWENKILDLTWHGPGCPLSTNPTCGEMWWMLITVKSIDALFALYEFFFKVRSHFWTEYCVVCNLNYSFYDSHCCCCWGRLDGIFATSNRRENAQRTCVWLIPIYLHTVLRIVTYFIITLFCDNWPAAKWSLCP